MKPMKIISIIGILLAFTYKTHAQNAPYSSNDKAGHYCDVGDAKIYYEVYGEGKPVVLLHGGYAYIDQFKGYVPILSKKYKVIAVATRGYGKSEIGKRKFSYNLFAEDVKKIIEKEGNGRAVLIGFSDGAITSYVVASKYPEVVRKVVCMGGASLGVSGYSKSGLAWLDNFRAEEFEYYRPNFKEIMPEPERWNDFIENMRAVWSEPNVLPLDNLKKIRCPVLMLVADRDQFTDLERVVEVYKRIPDARLAVFPGSRHIDISFRNIEILEQYILKFIE